jgi:ribonuclease Z
MTEKIKLTFLGTGSAVPTAKKNHPALLVSYKAENLLFDCGEGTQRQFRKAKLNPCKVTKIFLTHWHGDHTLGLPGLLQTLVLNGYNGTLEIHGPLGTQKSMDELLSIHLTFYLKLSKAYGTNLDIKVYEHKPGKIFENEEMLIESAPIDHYCQGLAYSFIIKEKSRLDKEKLTKLKIPNGPLIGELAKGKTISLNGKKIDGKKLIYTEEQRKICLITDTKYSENFSEFANNSDILICESTYAKGEEEMAESHGHMTCTQAAKIAKKSKSKKLFLTHLSQRYEAIPKKILEEAKEVFKDVVVAEDLMSLEI